MAESSSDDSNVNGSPNVEHSPNETLVGDSTSDSDSDQSSSSSASSGDNADDSGPDDDHGVYGTRKTINEINEEDVYDDHASQVDMTSHVQRQAW